MRTFSFALMHDKRHLLRTGVLGIMEDMQEFEERVRLLHVKFSAIKQVHVRVKSFPSANLSPEDVLMAKQILWAQYELYQLAVKILKERRRQELSSLDTTGIR
jgi:hypothetical protein